MNSEDHHRPTIKDVAQLANVSKSLVSLVMRNAPNVSPERRRAVLEAAAELGYRPNTVARSLVEGRTRTIGIVVSDLRNPWYVDIVDGFRRIMHANGFRALIGGGRLDHQVDPALPGAFLDLRVEGLCVVGTLPYDEALAEAMKAVPAVVASSHSYELPHVDSVVNDDESGSRQATEHLIAMGHQYVAHIGGGSDGVAKARRHGYETAMRAHGLDRNIRVVACDYDEQSGYRATQRLLRAGRRPTAIVAINDLACVGALTAVTEAGLSVPADMSLVGYDNTNLAALSYLSLTSVDPQNEGIGELAARRILTRISHGAGTAPEDGERDMTTPTLVVRKSTARPPETVKEDLR